MPKLQAPFKSNTNRFIDDSTIAPGPGKYSSNF